MKNIVKFRPKARIIHTLGSEIIKDSFAAIIELVKNSYDADAEYVIIKFSKLDNKTDAQIVITDDGHGMTYDIVANVWMIPGTKDKIERKSSPNGRLFLGAKGIGRLAAGRIGSLLTLETTDKNRATTILKVNWNDFFGNNYLDQLEFEIEIQHKHKEPGTEIIIDNIADEWFAESTIESLIKELRKLLSPAYSKKEKFGIFIDMEDAGNDNLKKYHGEIEPFPVFEYFDYRLWGKVKDDGTIQLKFQNGVLKNLPSEFINAGIDYNELEITLFNNCLSFGEITIDIRVFDRDSNSIDELITRSKLWDDNNKYLGKREAKKLLDELSGVSIFREGFRIRPYGDSGYDWLELDRDRVQNPTMRIGSDQIAGYIQIGNENQTGLIEKSSREGFFENQNYFDLIKVVKRCIAYLEEKRFDFRKRTGRGRTVQDIGNILNDFLSLDKLKINITKKLNEENTSEEIISEVGQIISKELNQKTQDYEKIQETLSLYEGQVTLGKIVGVLMHEGRKPVKYIDEQSPRISKWINYLLKQKILVPEEAIFSKEEILDRLDGLRNEAKLLIALFSKVDPLAVKKRKITSNIPINELLNRTKLLFESEFKKYSITSVFNFKEEYTARGAESDIYIILTNLFDNSIYWLSTSKRKGKLISVDLFYDDDNIVIDFIDNGPGIKDEFIESIFEPGFSTKPRGTGLGLSIAGEAASRNGGTIKLMNYKNGTYFRINLLKGKNA
ncbi:MAG: ATP-binding protein [Ignavibacteriaceae bacterium]|nr:ATP-binding protein [Ignavibacteriaceae bacterium]